MKGNNKHGGRRAGSGRKTKIEKSLMVNKLTPYDNKAFKALENGLDNGEAWAVKLFLEYRFGRPKQIIEQTNTHNFNEDFNITTIYNRKDK